MGRKRFIFEEMMTLGCAAALLAIAGANAFTLAHQVIASRYSAWVRYDQIRRATHDAREALHPHNEEGLRRALARGAVLSRGEAAYEFMLSVDPSAHPGIAGLLIDAGADVNTDGGRLLAVAIQAGGDDPAWIPVARKMVECGADVNAKGDGAGTMTPLEACVSYCRRLEDVELARLLIERGADVNGRSGEMTPLMHLAARLPEGENALALAALLVEKGADVNAKGNGTALEWARTTEKKRLAEFLLKKEAKE